MSRVINDGGDFGFCDLKWVDATNGAPVIVDFQHNLSGARVILIEVFLKNRNHELHGSVVIVHEKDFVQSGFFDFGLFFSNDDRS